MLLRLLILSCLVLGACGGDREFELPEGFSILATVESDLDGDGRPEVVHLVGADETDSPFRTDFCLVVEPRSRLWPLPSDAESGYGPVLEAVDVTGDGRPEVIMTADTGGSGGLAVVMVATIEQTDGHWKFTSIFGSQSSAVPRIGGAFDDGFTADLEVDVPGLGHHVHPLDLTGRRPFYLETKVYDEDGTLLKPVEIWGEGLMAADAVGADVGGPGLRLVQQPRGAANVDRLAQIITLLVWRDGGWTAVDLSILPAKN